MKPKKPSIENYISRAVAGLPGASKELLKRISPEIYQYLRVRVSLHDADDIMQDILMIVFTEIKGLNDARTFNAWCWAVVSNKVRDHWRKKERHHMDSLPEATEGIKACQDHVTPEQIVSDREQSAQLHKAMCRLPDEEAYAVFLYYWEDQPIEVISREMGRPTGTIKRWLSNARGRLKEWLDE